jgi:hypothetical protein
MAEVYISAGGVEVKVDGDEATTAGTFAIWEKVLDRISNGRNRVGAGTGLVTEQAVEWDPGLPPQGSSGDPDIRIELFPPGFAAGRRRPGCFHTGPGCNC